MQMIFRLSFHLMGMGCGKKAMRGSEDLIEIGASLHDGTGVVHYDISARAASKSRSGLSKMRRKGGS